MVWTELSRASVNEFQATGVVSPTGGSALSAASSGRTPTKGEAATHQRVAARRGADAASEKRPDHAPVKVASKQTQARVVQRCRHDRPVP